MSQFVAIAGRQMNGLALYSYFAAAAQDDEQLPRDSVHTNNTPEEEEFKSKQTRISTCLFAGRRVCVKKEVTYSTFSSCCVPLLSRGQIRRINVIILLNTVFAIHGYRGTATRPLDL